MKPSIVNDMAINKPEFESLDQMAGVTASALAKAAASSAFHLFRDRQFRRLADLEQLSQTEQDRIFNELMVAFIVLIMLALEAPDLRIPGGIPGLLRCPEQKIPRHTVE